MSEHTDLLRRLDATASRADDAARRKCALEDVLADGYADALAGEAASRRLQKELQSLLPALDDPAVAKRVRRLALQRRALDEKVSELRDKLARLRDEFARGRRGEAR